MSGLEWSACFFSVYVAYYHIMKKALSYITRKMKTIISFNVPAIIALLYNMFSRLRHKDTEDLHEGESPNDDQIPRRVSNI